MGHSKISKEEQLNIRNRAKAELERLEKIQADIEKVKILDNFKNKFNMCETTYKIILAEHQKNKNVTPNGYLKLDMRQVPHALTFAGYDFNKELLTELFGSKSTK